MIFIYNINNKNLIFIWFMFNNNKKLNVNNNDL